MQTPRWPAAAFAALLALAPPVGAQVSELPPEVLADEEPYRLIYDHVSATFRLEKPDGSAVAGWDASAQRALAPVPPDRPLEVVVENANTLLYDYAISAEPVQGGRRVRPCRDVGREALSTGFFVGSRGFGGATDAFADLAGTLEEVADVRSAAEEDSPFSFVDEAGSASALMAEARGEAERYERLLARAEAVAADLDGAVVQVATLAEVQPIGPLVDSVMSRLNTVQQGLGNPRLAPAVLASQRGRAETALNTLAALGEDDFSDEARTLRTDLRAAAEREREVAADIQETLLTLARAKAASTQRVTALPAGVHRMVRIEIRDNEEDLLVRRTREGSVLAYTKPAVSLVCEVSFGLAWMEPPAEYRLDRDGRLTDAALDDDIRTSASLLLHLSASAVPALGVVGGIGIGSGTAPDLYLGGTLRLFRPLMLNGGVVWQRQHVLPAGMALGNVIDDPAALDDLERGYRPSAFFGVSFGR